MIKPYPMNPACALHIRAVQDHYPESALFFRYYNQFWKATPTGFAVVGADQIDALAFSLAIKRNVSVVVLNDLHLPPFNTLHFNAAETFTFDVQQ